MQSEEIQDIMGSMPKQSIRWGISILFIVFLALMSISYFVSYPDIIASDIEITRLSPPFQAISKSTGRLDRLWVKDKQHVSSNEVLVTLDAQSNTEDVLKTGAIVQRLRSDLFTHLQDSTLVLQPNLNLGTLQYDYTNFVNRYADLQLFVTRAPIAHEIKGLENQLVENQNLLSFEKQRKVHFVKELELTYEKQKRDETLFKTNVISKEQYETFQKDVLAAERLMSEIDAGIARMNVEIAKLRTSIDKLKYENETRNQNMRNDVLEAFRKLEVSMTSWEEKYLIKSPIAGEVSFVNFWSSNQNVKLGDVILIVVPERDFNIIGKMNITARNSGKVRTGQKVFIRLNNYPYEEFGSLTGIVNSISSAPVGDNYTVEIHLKGDKLSTTYGREIRFQDGLSGTAEIILQESSLMKRMFNLVAGTTGKYAD